MLTEEENRKRNQTLDYLFSLAETREPIKDLDAPKDPTRRNFFRKAAQLAGAAFVTYTVLGQMLSSLGFRYSSASGQTILNQNEVESNDYIIGGSAAQFWRIIGGVQTSSSLDFQAYLSSAYSDYVYMDISNTILGTVHNKLDWTDSKGSSGSLYVSGNIASHGLTPAGDYDILYGDMNIVGSGTLVSAHAARHEISGADPILDLGLNYFTLEAIADTSLAGKVFLSSTTANTLKYYDRQTTPVLHTIATLDSGDIPNSALAGNLAAGLTLTTNNGITQTLTNPSGVENITLTLGLSNLANSVLAGPLVSSITGNNGITVTNPSGVGAATLGLSGLANSVLSGPLVSSLSSQNGLTATNPSGIGASYYSLVLNGSTLSLGSLGLSLNLGNANAWTAAQIISLDAAGAFLTITQNSSYSARFYSAGTGAAPILEWTSPAVSNSSAAAIEAVYQPAAEGSLSIGTGNSGNTSIVERMRFLGNAAQGSAGITSYEPLTIQGQVTSNSTNGFVVSVNTSSNFNGFTLNDSSASADAYWSIGIGDIGTNDRLFFYNGGVPLTALSLYTNGGVYTNINTLDDGSGNVKIGGYLSAISGNLYLNSLANNSVILRGSGGVWNAIFNNSGTVSFGTANGSEISFDGTNLRSVGSSVSDSPSQYFYGTGYTTSGSPYILGLMSWQISNLIYSPNNSSYSQNNLVISSSVLNSNTNSFLILDVPASTSGATLQSSDILTLRGHYYASSKDNTYDFQIQGIMDSTSPSGHFAFLTNGTTILDLYSNQVSIFNMLFLENSWGSYTTLHEAIQISRNSSSSDSEFIAFVNGLSVDYYFGRKPNDDTFYWSTWNGSSVTDQMALDPSGRLRLPQVTTTNTLLLGASSDLNSNTFGLAIALPSGASQWPLGIVAGGGSSGIVVFSVTNNGQLRLAQTQANDGYPILANYPVALGASQTGVEFFSMEVQGNGTTYWNLYSKYSTNSSSQITDGFVAFWSPQINHDILNMDFWTGQVSTRVNILDNGSGATTVGNNSQASNAANLTVYENASSQGDNLTHFGYNTGSGAYNNYIRGATTYVDSYIQFNAKSLFNYSGGVYWVYSGAGIELSQTAAWSQGFHSNNVLVLQSTDTTYSEGTEFDIVPPSPNTETRLYLVNANSSSNYGGFLFRALSNENRVETRANGTQGLNPINFYAGSTEILGLSTGGELSVYNDLLLAREDQAQGFIIRPNVSGYKKMAFAVSGGGNLDAIDFYSTVNNFHGPISMVNGTATSGNFGVFSTLAQNQATNTTGTVTSVSSAPTTGLYIVGGYVYQETSPGLTVSLQVTFTDPNVGSASNIVLTSYSSAGLHQGVAMIYAKAGTSISVNWSSYGGTFLASGFIAGVA